MNTVRLFKEADVNVHIPGIVENLNRICDFTKFALGESQFELFDKIISHPGSYNKLNSDLIKETAADFKAILVTHKRYDNNYFFQSSHNRLIISFFAWEHLTNLTLNNGLVFFIADIIALNIDNSDRHSDNPKPECIYDFGWNKAGVDLGMRSAMICPDCIDRINKKNLSTSKKELMSDLQKILNDLGNASKWESDILEYWKIHSQMNVRNHSGQRNRVFISYSHRDSEWLRRLKTHFKPFERTAVIEVWDDTKIGTGDDWKQSIKDALKTTKVAVLLVSPDFLASDFIANEELPHLLEAAKKEGAVIMPIILKPCGFERIPALSKFQAVNSPSRTLVEMNEGDQERFLLKLIEDVLGSLT